MPNSSCGFMISRWHCCNSCKKCASIAGEQLSAQIFFKCSPPPRHIERGGSRLHVIIYGFPSASINNWSSLINLYISYSRTHIFFEIWSVYWNKKPSVAKRVVFLSSELIEWKSSSISNVANWSSLLIQQYALDILTEFVTVKNEKFNHFPLLPIQLDPGIFISFLFGGITNLSIQTDIIVVWLWLPACIVK